MSTSLLGGPSAQLSPRVEIAHAGSDRATLARADVELVLVAIVMQFELCYVSEWVEYHLAHGGPRTSLYLLPQRGPALSTVHDAGQERFMHEFSVAHPRVHVLCNVSGAPDSCASPAATAYSSREAHQALMLTHLVPRREYIALLEVGTQITLLACVDHCIPHPDPLAT